MMRHYSRFGTLRWSDDSEPRPCRAGDGAGGSSPGRLGPRRLGRGNSDAYRNGYNAGSREGERDGRDRKDYGFKRDDVYEDADWGFNGGSKSDYKRRFRQGYESGYDQGYRRYAAAAGGGWGRPGNGGYYPGDRYPGGGGLRRRLGNSGRFAYRNGYSDGYRGRPQRGRPQPRFNPTGESRYRSATRGYDSRYGSRGAYQQDYRSGFRSWLRGRLSGRTARRPPRW